MCYIFPSLLVSFLQFDFIALFESIQPLPNVIGELGNVLARYEPCGQVDNVVEHLVAIACRRAQITIATRSTCSALVAHLTLGQQCVIVYSIKLINNISN